MNYFQMIIKCSILLNLDVPVTFDTVSNDEYLKICECINNVNNDLCATEDVRWTFKKREATITLVTGQNVYPAPSGELRNVTIDTMGANVRYVYDSTDITRFPISEGIIQAFAIDNENIIFNHFPTSQFVGKDVSISYYTDLPAITESGNPVKEMTLETDSTIVPEKYQTAIIFGACRDYIGKPSRDNYQHHDRRYNETLVVMRKKLRDCTNREAEFVLDVSDWRNGNDTSFIDDFFSPRH